MRALPWGARVYVAAVALAAIVACGSLVTTTVDWLTLGITAILFIVVESISIIRVRRVSVSASFPVVLAAVILLGPSAAAFVGLMAAVSYRPGGLPPVKRLFNGSQMALCGMSAGLVYEVLGGGHPLDSSAFPGVIAIVLVVSGVYALVNASLVAVVLTVAEGAPLVEAWLGTISTGLVSYLGYGLFGLLMAVLWSTELAAFAAVLVLLPFFVARWAFAQYAEQREAYERTVRTLVQAVETKDYYTRGHSERVSRGSEMLARALGMRENRVELLRFAGILHDLGKLGVPTRVLQKGSALTQDEFEAIKLHPVRGVEMVREIAFLHEAYDGIMHHHERMDGCGYPLGLKGEAIPEFARAIAVADAFDSMTSTRSYRSARSVPEAIEELQRCKGTYFDPRMVDAFILAVQEEGWTAAEAPAVPPAPGVTVTRLDHDDPTRALPVIRGDPS